MNKDNNQTNKTILNVGFCETNSEWLDRVINELADESTNKMNFDIICRQSLKLSIGFQKKFLID